MRAANSLKELTKASEAALGRLGFGFGRGGRQGVVEFNITSPSAFTVLLEDLATPYGGDVLLGFLRPAPTRTNVLITVQDGDSRGYVAASSYAKELVAGLKKEPWKGLGFVSGRTARVLWERWLTPDKFGPDDPVRLGRTA